MVAKFAKFLRIVLLSGLGTHLFANGINGTNYPDPDEESRPRPLKQVPPAFGGKEEREDAYSKMRGRMPPPIRIPLAGGPAHDHCVPGSGGNA